MSALLGTQLRNGYAPFSYRVHDLRGNTMGSASLMEYCQKAPVPDLESRSDT